MRRVVVTGMAGLTSLGSDWATIRENFAAGRTGIRRMADWDQYEDLNTRLAGPIEGFSLAGKYPRKKLRSMGPVAQLAVKASEMALEDAGLLDDPVLRSGRAGVSYGSSFGSTEPVLAFTDLMRYGKTSNLTATSYIKSH